MASDAEIVVGARNEAKAVFDEIGSQLRGLAIPAQDGAARADAAIGAMLANLASAPASLSGAFVALGGAITKVASAAAGLTGVLGVIGLGVAGVATVSAISSINDEADALDSLNRRLDAYVGAGRVSAETAKAFAAELKRSLGVSEEDTIQLMEKASVLGVTQDKLDEAATAAIGLSRALGIDMSSALTKVVNGDQDLVDMLGSINSGLAEQGEEVKGLAGLWNLVEVQTKKTIEFISAATQPLQQMFVSIGDYIRSSVITGIIGAVTAVEVFRDRTADSLQFIGVAWDLVTLQLSEAAKHAFTVQLPAYTIWFIDNTFNLFQDGFNAILTIFQNFNVAASKAIVLLWDFIASGGAGGLERLTQDMLSVADTLLVGFEAKAESLPEVMKRKVTEEEASLKDKMAALGSSLGTTFNDRFAKNLAAIEVVTPQLDAKALELKNASQAESGKKGSDSSLSVNESRLITRGRGEDIAKQQLAAQNAANARLDEIARNTANGGTFLKTVGAKV